MSGLVAASRRQREILVDPADAAQHLGSIDDVFGDKWITPLACSNLPRHAIIWLA